MKIPLFFCMLIIANSDLATTFDLKNNNPVTCTEGENVTVVDDVSSYRYIVSTIDIHSIEPAYCVPRTILRSISGTDHNLEIIYNKEKTSYTLKSCPAKTLFDARYNQIQTLGLNGSYGKEFNIMQGRYKLIDSDSCSPTSSSKTAFATYQKKGFFL